MPLDIKTPRLVNPALNVHSGLLFPTLCSYQYLVPFIPLTIGNEQIIMPHLVVSLKKPAAFSHKTKTDKPERRYFAVASAKALGSGAYGYVYPILGFWRQNEDKSWRFTSKAEDKSRLLKSNLDASTNTVNHSVIKSYTQEQNMGRLAPYMGYAYPPIDYPTADPKFTVSFLVLKKQQGDSFDSLLNRLNENPNFITITQRIRISINLLIAPTEQVHNIELPQLNPENKAHMLHCDLSPGNVLVNTDGKVTIIDFGMAKTTAAPVDNKISGTPTYIDPYVLSSNKIVKDSKSRDFASISRMIAELWGDDSRQTLTKIDELHQCNRTVTTNNLLPQSIHGLSVEERASITRIINRLLAFVPKNRMKPQEAVTGFQNLLANRLAQEEEYNKTNATTTSIEVLSCIDLVCLLRSNYLPDFIQRLSTYDESFPLLLKQLNANYATLDEAFLNQCKEHGYDFNDKLLTAQDIELYRLTAKQVAALLTLGVTLTSNTLQQWFSLPLADIDNLTWVTILRVILRQQKMYLKTIRLTETSEFKFAYFSTVLADHSASKDEAYNVQLVKRHLVVRRAQQNIVNDIIQRTQTLLGNTALGEAILKSEHLALPEVQRSLLLAVPTHLASILTLLQTFEKLCKELQNYAVFPTLIERSQALHVLRQTIHKMQNLDGYDWQTALCEIPVLMDRHKFLWSLDGKLYSLLKHLSFADFPLVFNSLDDYYQLSHCEIVALEDSIPDVIKCVNSLKRIDSLKKEIKALDGGFSDASTIENGLNALKASLSIHNALRAAVRVLTYENVYVAAEQFYAQCHQVANEENTPSSNRLRLYQLMHEELGAAASEGSTAALETLLGRLNRIVEQEKLLDELLCEHPAAMDYIYGLIFRFMHSQFMSSLDRLLQITYTLMDYELFDHPILDALELLLTVKAKDDDSASSDNHLPQLETNLWGYVNCSMDNIDQHKKSFLETLEGMSKAPQHKRSSSSNWTSLSFLSTGKKARKGDEEAIIIDRDNSLS